MRGIESVFANTDIDVLCSYEHMDTHLAKLFSVQLLPEKIRCNYLDIRVVRVFLAKSLACLGLAILLFVTQTITKLSPGVAAIGTDNIVGLCHISEVPVHLFANSLKFSFHLSSNQNSLLRFGRQYGKVTY